MSLSELKNSVKNRILTNYFKAVRKPKATWGNYIGFASFPFLWGCSELLVYFLKMETSFFAFSVSVLLLMLITALFLIALNQLIEIKSIFNFKKASDKFFRTLTTVLPIIENESDIKKYIKHKEDDITFNYTNYKTKFDIENEIKLNDQEISELKKMQFTIEQKNEIVKILEKGESLSLKTLEDISMEKLIKEEEIRLDNLKPHVNFLKEIGCAESLIKIKPPENKQSLKYLL